jgi:RecA-family ATPase
MNFPDYIARQLSEPAPGNPGRHEAWTKLAYQMVGEHIPDETIFYELRKWIPDRDKPDSELHRAIAGAHRRNPSPATSGKVGGEYDHQRKIIRFRVADAPVGPEEILPLKEHSTVDFLGLMFQEGEVICITSTAIERDGKYQPANVGAFLAREEWTKRFNDAKNETRERPWLSGDAGAWIRINPMKPGDHSGTDSGVASFRHLLVEFDSIPKAEQWRVYKECHLPIACVIDSGGKSLHAWVRVDADSLEQFRERQRLAYDYLGDYIDDGGNINPSRFSRLPGIMRGDAFQKLVALNIGSPDWEEFENRRLDDEQGRIVSWKEWKKKTPKKRPQVIEGVLAKSGIMVLGGKSKTNKSWSLIALSHAVRSGGEWLGNKCVKGNVLYVNFELHEDTMWERCTWVEEAMSINEDASYELDAWNKRGKAGDIEMIVDRFCARLQKRKTQYDLIILDPAYCCLGWRDENKAGDMTDFFNHILRLTVQSGAAVAIATHFAKGIFSEKSANDRISGSGVISRFADAIVVISPSLDGHGKEIESKFEADWTLREFAPRSECYLKWATPIMSIDPKAITREQRKEIAKKQQEEDQDEDTAYCFGLLPAGGASHSAWKKICKDNGINKSRFDRVIRHVKKDGCSIVLGGGTYKKTSLRPTTNDD